MSSEGPDGPDLSLKELEAIAWAEARRAPGLTPNGGRRWTGEDIEFAVAVLDEEMRSLAFRKAWGAGMTKGAVRLWLSKALHNRLLDHAECVARLMLRDHLALDDLSRAEDDRTHLSASDREILARRVLRRLSAAGRLVTADYFRHDGIPERREGGERRSWQIALRTRGRLRARFRQILRNVIEDAELNWDEALDLVFALSAKLTGGGAFRRENPRIRGRFRRPRALVLMGAKVGPRRRCRFPEFTVTHGKGALQWEQCSESSSLVSSPLPIQEGRAS